MIEENPPTAAMRTVYVEGAPRPRVDLTVALLAGALLAALAFGGRSIVNVVRSMATDEHVQPLLSQANAFESSHRIAINSTTIPFELKNDLNIPQQAYSCSVTAATAATGIFVVSETDSSTADGHGPFCTATDGTCLSSVISGDSKRAWVLPASGVASEVRCRFGHQ